MIPLKGSKLESGSIFLPIHSSVTNLFNHFDNLATVAGQLMRLKLKPLIEAVENDYHEKRRDKYLKVIYDYCDCVPIVGFNSGFYDTGLMLNYDFLSEILKRDPKPLPVKHGARYKFIKTKHYIFLDQSQYLPPTYNLDQFIKAFDGGESKGFFPYEWLDDFKKLDLPFDTLKREDFDSKLKNKVMSDEDFTWLKSEAKKLGWRTVRDLLQWYNNRDVHPFLKACLNMKEFLNPLQLDMYKDGYSLPAQSEKILFLLYVRRI